MGFNKSKAKIHKNRFNKKKRIVSIKNRIVFYLKIILVVMIVPVLSITFIFIYDCITQSESFALKTIEIEGNNTVSKEEIIKESGIKAGDNIFALSLPKVRRKILADPRMAYAEVRRKIPSAIIIKIKEHKCLAVLDIGKKYLINEQEEIYKEKDDSDKQSVPLIQGLSFSDLNLNEKKKTTVFDSVMTVLKFGQNSECILPNSKIKSIEVDRQTGLTIVAFEEKKIIKLGFSNYKDKYERLKSVLNDTLNIKSIESIYLDNGLDRIVVSPANNI